MKYQKRQMITKSAAMNASRLATSVKQFYTIHLQLNWIRMKQHSIVIDRWPFWNWINCTMRMKMPIGQSNWNRTGPKYVGNECLDGLIAVCNGFVNAYLFFSMISGLFSKSWSPSQRWTIRYIIAIVWSSLAAATQRYKHFKCSETDCTAQQCWHTMYKWWTLFEACANFQLERELYFICISVEKRVPWIGIGAGAVFGMIIVILDIFFTKKPTLSVRE